MQKLTCVDDVAEAAPLLEGYPLRDEVVRGGEQERLREALQHAAGADQLPTTLKLLKRFMFFPMIKNIILSLMFYKLDIILNK